MSCSCNASKTFVTNEEYFLITDTFGPFHDETILSGIDKVLYFIGTPRISPSLLQIATKVLRLIGNSGIEEIAKNFSSISMAQFESLIQDFGFNMPSTTSKKDTKSDKITSSNSVRFNNNPQCNTCPKCGGKPIKKSPAKLSSLPKKVDPPDPKGSRCSKKCSVRRSVSLSSLPCRNEKENLENFQKNNSEWICKQKRNAGKHQVYEVFRNTKKEMSSRNPSKQSESPNMILIVTPCGKVFPFQTVSPNF